MAGRTSVIQGSVAILVVWAVGGCGVFTLPTGSAFPNGRTGEVASKAVEVGELIGGPNGFGGTLMTPYASHMEAHMGFHSTLDLAQEGDELSIRLHNESAEDCTFRLVYIASQVSTDEQTMDVGVGAGEFVDVPLACMEIIGLGSLTEVGDTAVELENSVTLDNALCVPGFLGSDFVCGARYECFLTQDVDDLDGDGNTEELIVTTNALLDHLAAGGFASHHDPMHMGMGIRFP